MEETAQTTATQPATQPAKETQAQDVATLLKEQEKRLTEEHAAKIKEAVAKAKEEAEKLAKLSADERLKAELEQSKNDLLAKERELNRKELKISATKTLAEKGLPTKFLDYLIAQDEKETLARIEEFKKEYDEAISKAVNEKLKGKTPKGGGQDEAVTGVKNGFFEAIYSTQAKRR